MKEFFHSVQKVLLLLIITLGLIQTTNGQFLHFIKLGHRMQVNYHQGDEIGFVIKETGQVYTGTITAITDSTIVFEQYSFKPEEIGRLLIDRKIRSFYMLKYVVPTVMMMVGVGYPIIETVNTGRINERAVIQGVSLIGGGLLIKLLQRNSLPVNDRYVLRIIHSVDPQQRELDQAN